MVDIQIQPHADGIGGHQVINLAILIKRHLCVAGAGAERAHHHRGTALLAAQQLGNGIYIINRKPNNCAAGLHPAYLFRTCVHQLRHALAADELRLRHQFGNGGAHGVRAQKNRF